MDVDRDERLKAHGVNLAEIARRLRDEHVEDVEKLLIGRLHDLLVVDAVRQSFLRVACPHELQCQQAHLQRRSELHVYCLTDCQGHLRDYSPAA